MLYKLKPSEYIHVQALLTPLDYNLSLLSLLDGKTPGEIFVDHPTRPSAAFVNLGHHFFFAGSSQIAGFNPSVRELLQRVILPHHRAAGKDVFIIHFENDTWKASIGEILEELVPLERTRQYFEATRLAQDWRELLPAGFDLHPLSAELVAQSHLKHIDYLRDELCSERPTIEDFLRYSFGFVLQHGDDLASWCLSEYNAAGRCEVGVATVDEYQKRGLATITSLALVEHALSHGYTRVGWHCWKWNIPSSSLARKAGFDPIRDYPVYICSFNLGIQFALRGYDEQKAGNTSTALAWYQKALSTAGAPPWAYYNTARCLARQGQPVSALEALRQAFKHGFDDLSAARSEPDLESIRSIPAWDTIIMEQ